MQVSNRTAKVAGEWSVRSAQKELSTLKIVNDEDPEN